MFQARFYLLCIWILSAVASAAGQARTDTTINLPEATVTADRDETSRASAVTRVTAIPLGNAERQRSRSLADLLDTSTGLYVRRYGPSGAAGLTFRGTDPSQTEILLDGLRITDPQSGQVDLSLIPVVLLQSVEILHGTGASSGTSGGLGGTVLLRTLRTEQRGRIRLRGATGAYGRRSVSALAGGGKGIVSGVVAAEHASEDGAFPYVNEALQPPQPTTRAGADMKASSLFGKVTIRGTAHQATLAGWVNQVKRGLPGPGNAPPVPSRQEDEQLRTWLNSRHVLPGVTLSTDWSVQRARLRYTNPNSATDDRTATTSLEGRVTADIPVAGSVLLRSGTELKDDVTAGIREHRAALFGSASAEIGDLIADASLRGETWFAPSGTRKQLVPRAGLNVKAPLVRDIRLKIGAGRSWTVPSLIDRYWVPGGNRNLRPERGWSGEVGLLLDRKRLEIELTGFSATLNDRIVWNPSLVGAGVQVWRPTNIGKVHSYGLELSASTDATIGPGRRLHVAASLTYTEAVDRSDQASTSYGHQLKYVPRTVASTTANLKSGGFEIGASGHIVGKRYVTSDETLLLSSYAAVAARASYEVAFGPLTATFWLTSENLLNETYESIRFYPMPPRHFGFGSNLEWRKPE